VSGNCCEHTVQGPVYRRLCHCGFLEPWADAGAALTSGPELCVSARAGVPRTRHRGFGHCINHTSGEQARARQKAGTAGCADEVQLSEREQEAHTRACGDAYLKPFIHTIPLRLFDVKVSESARITLVGRKDPHLPIVGEQFHVIANDVELLPYM